jgi:8-oxo-dGTP pyrophosphatase MutT (NUDIX family)
MSHMTQHPRPNNHGQPVAIHSPSQATPLPTWQDPDAMACVVPDGPMPDELQGVPVERWHAASATTQEWEDLAKLHWIDEPAFVVPAGLDRTAAGAVVREPDGRIWLVAPTNQFGGYQATFPKGTLDGKSMQATALVEVFEETGLQIRLKRHLVDVPRTASYTRYYLAERLGGYPGDMCWEKQAVMLVPVNQLMNHLNSHHDWAIVDAIRAL